MEDKNRKPSLPTRVPQATRPGLRNYEVTYHLDGKYPTILVEADRVSFDNDMVTFTLNGIQMFAVRKVHFHALRNISEIDMRKH